VVLPRAKAVKLLQLGCELSFTIHNSSNTSAKSINTKGRKREGGEKIIGRGRGRWDEDGMMGWMQKEKEAARVYRRS
jgi:hypothetical protein